MITRSFIMKGSVTGTDSKTAKEIRDELRDLSTGASTAGGDITMVYDGDSITGAIEDMTITEKATDFDPASINTASSGQQAEVGQYGIAVTFTQGTAI